MLLGYGESFGGVKIVYYACFEPEKVALVLMPRTAFVAAVEHGFLYSSCMCVCCQGLACRSFVHCPFVYVMCSSQASSFKQDKSNPKVTVSGS